MSRWESPGSSRLNAPRVRRAARRAMARARAKAAPDRIAAITRDAVTRQGAPGDGAVLIAPSLADDLAAPGRVPARRGRSLLARLVLGDVVASALAWTLAWLTVDADDASGLAFVALVTVATLGIASRQRLYRARVCAVRAVELARIGRVSVRAALFAAILMWAHGLSSWPLGAFVGAAASFVSLSLARSAYRSVLMRARREGRYRRRIVVIGTDDGGAMLVDHIRRNPASGFTVAGVMGDRDEHMARSILAPYLGSISDVAVVAREIGANGAIVSAGALPLAQINDLTHELLDHDLHVQITAGLHGFSHHRVTANDLAYEPLLYVEPIRLSRSQAGVKRALDLIIAPAVLVATLPALALIAAVIKLTSRGPVIYRQRRVGRDNECFTIYKFRTMVDGAERDADLLAHHNEREGPLFKLDDDPRVTRIGRLLRATSLDEIPQLWNVINGTMTLVGPRPALPAEVACFDSDLLRRFSVPPGITGLWQLEARDEPDFEAYRRLDLFYVENWSLSLDLAIIVGTVADVVVRAVAQLRRR